MSTRFPTIMEVLEIYQTLMDEFGGDAGIRDPGALDAAIMRPQMGYYESLVDQAAALMESLAINHPFIDGNKRAAFFVTDTFLRLNGYYIDCDNPKAHRFFMHLFETNSFHFEPLKNWLTDHIQPLVK